MVREVLQLDSAEGGSALSKGCFLSRKGIFCITVAVVAGLIATGLLVYYYTGCVPPNLLGSLSKHTEDSLDLVSNRSHDVRLPRSVLPDRYEIHLTPFIIPGNFTFIGRVTIRINVTEETNNITLHSKELLVDKSQIRIQQVDQQIQISPKDVTNVSDKDFLILHLTEKLQAGKQYYVSLNFTGILNNSLAGFYRSSYKDGNETRWLATTQFQATDARKAFPCFDEPALKARFKLFICHDRKFSAISNMPMVLKSKPVVNENGYVWDEFEESVPMSTYLVAFIVSDFVSVRDGKFAVWARKSAIHQTNYSLHIGPRILQHFDSFFGIPFPLPKMDMAAIPDFAAGAMENWGLITFRETAMLYEEGVSTRLNKQRVAIVVAHELAHQWFGNLVTPSWWSDLWLNEGFASYVEYLGVDAVEPAWKMLEQFVVLDINDAFDLDALQSSHPISAKVNHPDEIDEIFDKVSYSKGASIIRMMDHFLRRSVLKNGLTRYLKDREYGSAQQDDLWSSLTTQAHLDQALGHSMTVKQIMDTWTLQTGYPVIHVTRNYTSGSVRITQKRFQLIKSEKESNETWWIPLSYTTGDNPDFSSTYPSHWLKPGTETTLDLDIPKNAWVLFNLQLTGFYRVNYDEQNWRLLADQLAKKESVQVLSSISRAQLIGDAFNLARSGLLDYEIALNLTNFLKHEDEFVPWQAAYNALSYLRAMLTSTGRFDVFENHILQLINGTYHRLGFRDQPTDDHLQALLRELIVRFACSLGHEDCIKNALILFNNWKSVKNPDVENPISPNLKRVVYCTAARVGGVADWDFMWQRYLHSNLGSEKDSLINGLVCTKDAWVLIRLIDRAIEENGNIRVQDVERIFTSIAKASYTGQLISYRKMQEHWDWLVQRFGSGSFTLGRLVVEVTKTFNKKSDLTELKQWAHSNKEQLKTATQSVKQAIEYISANVKWMDSNYDKVVKWLEISSNFVS